MANTIITPLYGRRDIRFVDSRHEEGAARQTVCVSADDWRDLDEAFGSHQDPLAPRAGQPVDEAYAPLRQRILAALPAPFGWGPALA